MNMMRQPDGVTWAPTCWKAYDSAPPTIWPRPRPRYQKEKRGACSDLVYHWLLMSMSEGPMVASKMPRKTRDTSMVW